MKKLSLLFLAILAISFFLKEETPIGDKIAREYLSYIQDIPDGLNNFRSAQLTEEQLRYALQNLSIKRVIRLNGNGKDAGALTIEQEQAICDKFKVELVTINAHEGYIKGIGYVQSARMVQRYLLSGNALIHCRHGFDRAGAMVGYHLSQMGFSQDEIIVSNKWQNYIQKKGEPYQKYYETALNSIY